MISNVVQFQWLMTFWNLQDMEKEIRHREVGFFNFFKSHSAMNRPRASELSDCFIGYIKWGCIHLTVFYERRFFQQVMLFFHCACSYYCSLSVDGVSFRAFCTTIFWQMFNSHLADFIDCGSYSVPAAFLIKSMAATLAMLGCRRRSRRRVLRSIVFSLLLFSTFLRVH